MLARVPLVWMRVISRRPLWMALFCLATGCSHPDLGPYGLAERISPPTGVLSVANPVKPEPLAGPAISGAQESGEVQWKAAKSLPDSNAPPPCVPLDGKPSQPLALPHAPPPAVPLDSMPCQPLTLPDAIALAFRSQPRLRASLESIQQARGKEGIAFAAFLPTLSTGYSVGGFDLNVGGSGTGYSPATGTVPAGLTIQTGYELAELKLQWLVFDFGRRLGSYNQAGLATEISQLQTERAYQTVANDVATAYFQVLRARSLYRIARESVRRAEDDLDVARKLAKGGVVEREKVLRAEVALAQAQRAQDVAEEAEAVAVATLNLAIGLNVSLPTTVVDSTDVPPFTLSLADCLQQAVGVRREFRIARQSVQAAQEGSRVARADFAPRIVTEGNLLNLQQGSPRLHADLAGGSVKLEWGLFEGGKRVAELRVADSRTREAIAQADSIADTIAFQVTQAYRQLVTAHKGIERSRPAVDLARETYRLVVARSRQGDATPAELTDAEASLTRSEQDFANSVYDYLTAVNRLEYAMGTTATP
jgi:outer membrane protein